MNPIFTGVYKERTEIFTENLMHSQKVYGEKLVKAGSKEFRHWDPTRSKLAAAILNGLKELPATSGYQILYLGASTGTTVSHLSDIVKENGIIYAIEFSERVFRHLLDLSNKRKNIVPILADARKPELYKWVEEVDIVYLDLAQPDETEIAIRNAKEFLKDGGTLFIAIKSQSIDVTKNPKQVYEEEKQKLENSGFSVLQLVNLEPYEEKHAMIVAKK
jgi:fibrillarin-like pre-rRNA processing protein